MPCLVTESQALNNQAFGLVLTLHRIRRTAAYPPNTPQRAPPNTPASRQLRNDKHLFQALRLRLPAKCL
jgi:hypothetical protein